MRVCDRVFQCQTRMPAHALHRGAHAGSQPGPPRQRHGEGPAVAPVTLLLRRQGAHAGHPALPAVHHRLRAHLPFPGGR